MAKGKKLEKWDVVLLQLPDRSVPALEFLTACPVGARGSLLATVVAVQQGPPPAFRGGLRWQVMHGEMGGIYEARDRLGKTLYRLFCLLDRLGTDHGLDRPSVVLLSGATKPDGTEMDEASYAAAMVFRDQYNGSAKRPILLPAGLPPGMAG
jgi:hypothetical protein